MECRDGRTAFGCGGRNFAGFIITKKTPWLGCGLRGVLFFGGNHKLAAWKGNKMKAKSLVLICCGFSIFTGSIEAQSIAPAEVDTFSNSRAEITVLLPGGRAEHVVFGGVLKVGVSIPPDGKASDTDGDGRDQVSATVMEMNLTGFSSLGKMTLRTRSSAGFLSLGEVEESSNATKGVLDLPPFTATGRADSFFDVFFEIQAGNQVFHNAKPLRMQATISHLPPALGETYLRASTEPVDLLDANEQRTGIQLLDAMEVPNSDIEVDLFEQSAAEIDLAFPDGRTETLKLAGPTEVVVLIPPSGKAADADNNGREEVVTRMVYLSLKGNSSIGPVEVRLMDPLQTSSSGRIEEQANNTRGVLDLPPFTATGAADSSFVLFAEMQIGNEVFHFSEPPVMQGVITHKPPLPGETYSHLAPIELIDSKGQRTGIKVVREIHIPNPVPVEVDRFPESVASVEVLLPDGRSDVIGLVGPTTVNVFIGPNGEASDTDGNGRDQVRTEMVELNLKGSSTLLGAVSLRLRDPSKHPFQKSLGQIEEISNTIPGILDVPPFTAAGMAVSSFDVFFEMEAGGQVYHTDVPKRMRSIIRHKPPEGGATYEFPEVIELVDENDRPTGIKLIRTAHTPNPPAPEIDFFQDSSAHIQLQFPTGAIENVSLMGPTEVHVFVGPRGEAIDTDRDGRDQVTTEMVQLDLTGNSSLGPINVRLRDATQHPFQRSMGEIEEQANTTPGILDLAPFTTTGSADSFFDVFFEVQVGGAIYHADKPKRMQAVIHHKPPETGVVYEFPEVIDLLDESEKPTGIRIVKVVHTPNPPHEVDVFPISLAQITIATPNGGTEVVSLAGPSTVEVLIGLNGQASDSDGDGLDDVQTEMTQLDLKGTSSLGLVHVTLDPAHRTLGGIEEKANKTPGILDVPPFAAAGSADSFFDVFYLIQVGDRVFHPAKPVHMASVITHKPPAPGDTYVNPFTDPVELLDANGNPTGIKIVKEVHTPNPPKEVDFFPVSRAYIILGLPNGQRESLRLNGPTTVEVMVTPAGWAADLDGNGRDEVASEIVQLDLQGKSSLGPIQLRLQRGVRSLGRIEELQNNTRGILDLPPFAKTGEADSFFDVFFEVQVGDRILHGARAARLQSTIHHKPPRPGDRYESGLTTRPIEMLDANGNVTGIQLIQEIHVPEPRPLISALVRNGPKFAFAFSTLADETYQVEAKTLLGDPNWSPVSTIRGTGGDAQIEDAGATSAMKFYRIVEQPQ